MLSVVVNPHARPAPARSSPAPASLTSAPNECGGTGATSPCRGQPPRPLAEAPASASSTLGTVRQTGAEHEILSCCASHAVPMCLERLNRPRAQRNRSSRRARRTERTIVGHAPDGQGAMERLVHRRYAGGSGMPSPPQSVDETCQNNQARNCVADSASPPPNTMPEIWRFAPPSPNMKSSPPMTMATSARRSRQGAGERTLKVARSSLPGGLGKDQRPYW
jgi:hypothetical protein